MKAACVNCGQPTDAKYGICRNNPECRRRATREAARRRRGTPAQGVCDICGGPVKIMRSSTNYYGVCQRNKNCAREYQTRRTLVTRFNKSWAWFVNQLKTQDNCCAICKSPESGVRRWQVDHDRNCCPGYYSCGKCVRGLLCGRCNPMLGLAKDNIEILISAAAYLLDTAYSD